MTPKDAEVFSKFFHVPVHLVEYVPEILSDLWALGSLPGLIAGWFRELNLAEESRILDLGCGKGAVTITLAQSLNLKVTGIDYFEPFLKEAQKKAEELKVARLCNFILGDLRTLIDTMQDFDVVIMTAVGNVFGNYTETIKRIRKTIRAGGYILIDDGYLTFPQKVNFPGYEDYLGYEQTINALCYFGDRMIKEKIISSEEMKLMNDWNTERIARRIEDLAFKYPSYAQDFYDYLQWEKDECKILETEITSAVWLLQKV